MNFPAAVVGAHVNNKLLLMSTFLINGIISCLTPFVIMFEYDGSNVFLQNVCSIGGPGNWRYLVIIRGIQGLFQVKTFFRL